MNYDHLPQPPEGVLDPKIPWSRINPNSRLWVILKARLTGRPQDGHNYSSYVNISEADADRLIANMKKDPRGYPSLDQESGNPVQWMERQKLYQEWLVEAYLENPFREDVNKKIEAAEQERRLNEIQEEKRQRKEEQEEREKRRQEKQQVIPAPAAPPPAPVVIEPEAPPAAPVEPPNPKPTPLRDEDLVAPNQMPSNVSRAMAKYGTALDAIGIQLSKQNSILTRNLGYLRRIEEDLGDVKFFLEQMSENYQEALDDFEMEERKKEARKKFVARLTSPFQRKKQSPPKAQTPTKPKEDKPWWNFWDKPKQPEQKLSSGGFLNTPYPAMSEGGMYPGTPIPGLADGGVGIDQKSSGKIIQPGVYTNPVRGILPPGFAVIPTNRTWGKEILGIYDSQKFNQSLGEVLQKSISALLGAAVTVYGSVLRGLGPLAGFFNRSIPGIISTVSSILGISRNAVINMFGGPAYAGVAPNERDQKYFYRSWRIFMDKNRLYFPGAPGVFGGPKEKPEFAKDIAVIKSREDLRYVGGTNVGTLPAWIPFKKEDAKKIGYVSGFGTRRGRPHTGIDLDGDRGIEIITPFAGKITDINRGAVEGDGDAGGGYGNLVEIEHTSPKIFTFYGHLKDVASHLEVGKEVKPGEVIGTLGNTGISTGPHLHWEVRESGSKRRIDPVEWTHQNKPGLSRGGQVPVQPIEMQVTPKPPVSFVYDMLTVMAKDIIAGDIQPKSSPSYSSQQTTTATDSYLKPVVKEVTLQMPSQPSVSTTSTSSSRSTFVNMSRERTMVLLHQHRMMEYG